MENINIYILKIWFMENINIYIYLKKKVNSIKILNLKLKIISLNNITV